MVFQYTGRRVNRYGIKNGNIRQDSKENDDHPLFCSGFRAYFVMGLK